MSNLNANVHILMRDLAGDVVPGSVRRGHNVMTLEGKNLLTQLVCWGVIGGVDSPYSQRRPRYIGAGSGTQLEHPDVVRLVTPLTSSPGVYLKELDPSLTTFPTFTSVVLKAVFGPSEITHSAASVDVSEVGLFFDVSPGGSLMPASGENVPGFYKTFAPLTKLNVFSMEITWELKF